METKISEKAKNLISEYVAYAQRFAILRWRHAEASELADAQRHKSECAKEVYDYISTLEQQAKLIEQLREIQKGCGYVVYDFECQQGSLCSDCLESRQLIIGQLCEEQSK